MKQGIFTHRSGNLIDRSGNLSNRSGILAEHGDAFIYVTADATSAKPLPGYLEGVLAATVIAALPRWFQHYNTVHPNFAMAYRSPREFIAARSNPETVSGT